jgi:hypothetical protein
MVYFQYQEVAGGNIAEQQQGMPVEDEAAESSQTSRQIKAQHLLKARMDTYFDEFRKHTEDLDFEQLSLTRGEIVTRLREQQD